MDILIIRACILWVGWPLLLVGSGFAIREGYAFYSGIGKALVGKIIVLLMLGMIATMAALGVVASAYMLSDPDQGVSVVLPVFFVWLLLISYVLTLSYRLRAQAIAFNNEMKALDRAKDDFLIVASHQLRTPLTGIKWTLELAMKDTAMTESQKGFCNTVYGATEKLVALVNNLMSVVRIDTSKISKQIARFDVISLCRTSIAELAAIAAHKHQRIVLSSSLKEANAYFDRTLFSETLKNLLNNALQHSGEDAEISVLVSVTTSLVTVGVHNEGVAIPKEDQERIFNKFGRAEKDGSNLTQDVGGLGLYISKTFVKENGGTIWVDSSQDRGTTFSFTVPRTLVY